MKFTNAKQIEDFLNEIDNCQGQVYLRSIYGDIYNLKSKLNQYLAVAALLGEHGDELELFCDLKEDEARLLSFLGKNLDIIGIE